MCTRAARRAEQRDDLWWSPRIRDTIPFQSDLDAHFEEETHHVQQRSLGQAKRVVAR